MGGFLGAGRVSGATRLRQRPYPSREFVQVEGLHGVRHELGITQIATSRASMDRSRAAGPAPAHQQGVRCASVIGLGSEPLNCASSTGWFHPVLPVMDTMGSAPGSLPTLVYGGGSGPRRYRGNIHEDQVEVIEAVARPSASTRRGRYRFHPRQDLDHPRDKSAVGVIVPTTSTATLLSGGNGPPVSGRHIHIEAPRHGSRADTGAANVPDRPPASGTVPEPRG